MSKLGNGLLGVLRDAIEERAQKAGWQCQDSALIKALEADGPKGNALVAALGKTEPYQPPYPFPVDRLAMELAPTTITLLLCTLDSAEGEALNGPLWWAGLVRAELPPERRSDLQLFIVTTAEPTMQGLWRRRASEIEADERFCRKFVWLASVNSNQDDASEFLDRTLFARPWESGTAEPTALDPLAELSLDKDNEVALLNASEVAAWVELLADSGADFDAEKMLITLKGR
jgi:hypothetical protein